MNGRCSLDHGTSPHGDRLSVDVATKRTAAKRLDYRGRREAWPKSLATAGARPLVGLQSWVGKGGKESPLLELAIFAHVVCRGTEHGSWHMHLRAKRCLAAIVFLAASYFTNAQAQTTDGKGCTPQERSNKTLEHDRSNAGVLCPPEIDPGMTAPTPKTGDRSVIPPPGTPGGDPSVQPK